MIAAIVILAGVLAISVGGHVMQGLWLRTANREKSANAKLAEDYKTQRNELAISNAGHVKYIGELEAKVRVQHALLEETRKARTDVVVKGIANAPDADAALARLNSSLSEAARAKEARAAAGGDRAEEGALPPLETP